MRVGFMNKIIVMLVGILLSSNFIPASFAAPQDSSNLRPPAIAQAQTCSTSFFAYLGSASADSDRFLNKNFATYQDTNPLNNTAGEFAAVIMYLNQPVDSTHLPAGVTAPTNATTQLGNLCPGTYTVTVSYTIQN